MNNQLRWTQLCATLLIACGLASASVVAQTTKPTVIRSTSNDPALGVSSSKSDERAKTAKKPTGPARFEKEIAAFEKSDKKKAVPKDCILFVGSSSVRLWQTSDAFPNLPVVNRGFGGSTISDANHFADRIVFKYKPKTIVFYSGDNDIAAGRTPDRVFADYEKFAKSVHERLPNTRLIYLTIKPSPKRWKTWSKSQEVNARVRELTKKNDHDLYVDIATPMLGSDGEPRKELFRDDNLHMNPKGYEIWNKILTPILAKSSPRS